MHLDYNKSTFSLLLYSFIHLFIWYSSFIWLIVYFVYFVHLLFIIIYVFILLILLMRFFNLIIRFLHLIYSYQLIESWLFLFSRFLHRNAEHASYAVLDAHNGKVICIFTLSKRDDSGVKDLLGDHPFVFIENVSSKAMEDVLLQKVIAYFIEKGFAPDAFVSDRVSCKSSSIVSFSFLNTKRKHSVLF